MTKRTYKKAYLLVNHGSRIPKVREEADSLAQQLRVRLKGILVVPVYLSINPPSISKGIKICVDEGAKHIILLLNFFSSGSHVLKDIPTILQREQKKYKGVRFDICPPIGQNPKIVDLFKELADDLKDEFISYG